MDVGVLGQQENMYTFGHWMCATKCISETFSRSMKIWVSLLFFFLLTNQILKPPITCSRHFNSSIS